MVVEHLLPDLDIAPAGADHPVEADVEDEGVELGGAPAGAEVAEVSLFPGGTDGADSGIGDVFPGAADDEGAVDVEEDDAFFPMAVHSLYL